MLSVLLADDERVILRGLTKLIDWQKLGLMLIGEVYKGDDLLAAIIERSPDIVITDISMPGMSGIEVLKQLKALSIETKVIFISAYREFEYAQDALSYGAVDYLIKPIHSEKLEQILIKTVETIHKASKTEFNNSRLQHYEGKDKRQSINDFLEKLTEEKKLLNVPEMVRELGGDVPNIRFSIIAIEVDYSPKLTGSWVEGERKLLYFAIQNIMEEVIQDQASGWTISNRAYLYMILRHDKELSVKELAAQIHENIKKFLKLSVTLGIGMSGTLEQIPESYKQAKIGVAYKFFLGVNRLISYSSIPSSPRRSGTDRTKAEKELLKALSSTQNEIHVELLRHWLELIKTLSWGNRDYTVNLCNSMLIKVLRELSPAGDNIESEEQRYVQLLQDCETFEEMSKCIRYELHSLRLKIHQSNGSKAAVQMAQIKMYIEEHYQEEINLVTMSAHFYMNPYYFSSFFKKNTGQNFKQYLTEVRMKYALHLLMQTDSMLYEISERIGYNNARQFSEMFKKFYGMLPNEYRQQLVSGGSPS